LREPDEAVYRLSAVAPCRLTAIGKRSYFGVGTPTRLILRGLLAAAEACRVRDPSVESFAVFLPYYLLGGEGIAALHYIDYGICLAYAENIA